MLQLRPSVYHRGSETLAGGGLSAIRLSQDRTWAENTSDREWKPAGWAATSSFTTSLEALLGELPPHHGLLRCISQAEARPHRTGEQPTQAVHLKEEVPGEADREALF